MQDRLTLVYEFLNRGAQNADQAKRQVEAIGKAAEQASRQLNQAEQIRARVSNAALSLATGGTFTASAFNNTTSSTNFEQVSRRVTTGLRTIERQAQQTGKTASQSLESINTTLGRGVVELGGLLLAFHAYRRLIQETVIDTTRLAARNETLAVVTGQLARANNLSRDAVFGVARAVEAQGITTSASLDAVNKLIFAQIDLAKAADLARLSQNAAVIAGENSSETLNRLIFGITTRQTEVLRRAGINVLFEPEFIRRAQELGRELTEVEKNQIAYNLVLAQGAKITGVYEASLVTAEKRLGSLARFVEQAQVAVGEHYVPAFSRAIDLATDLANATERNAAAFAELGRVTASLSAGAGIAMFLRLAGASGAIGGLAGVAVGAATYALSNVDPIDETVRNYTNAVQRLDQQRQHLEQQVRRRAEGSSEPLRDDTGLVISAEQLQGRLDSLRANISALRADAVRDLLRATQLKAEQIEASRVKDPFDVLGGVTRRRLEQVKLDGPESLLQPTTQIGPFGILREELTAERLRQNREGVGPGAIDKLVSGLVEQNERDQLTARERVERLQQLQKSRERLLDIENRLFVDLAADRPEQRLRREQSVRRRGLVLDQDSSARLASVEEAERQLLFFEQAIERAKEINKLREELAEQLNKPIPQEAELFRGDPRDPLSHLSADFRRFGEGDPAREAEAAVRAIEARVQARERILALSLGPGREFSAIQSIENLRIAAAEQVFQITRDELRLNHEIASARLDAEVRVAELRREQQEEFVQNVQQAFDAIATRGATGLREFVEAQLQGVQRTIVGNIAREFFQASRDRFQLQLPGQTKDGELTLLGRLLRGTPFGVDPAQLATDLNTRATEANTAALLSLSGALTGTSGGSTGSGAIGAGFGTAQAVAGLFGSRRTSSTGTFAGDPRDPLTHLSPEVQAIINESASRSTRTATRTIGTVGAIAGAGFGIYSGIRQGGAQGYTTAAASALGAASLIPGPQQPFVAAGALIAGFVSSFLGNSAEEHGKRVADALDRNRFDPGTPLGRDLDLSGREVDFGRTGEVRTIVIQDNRSVNVNAIDRRSILDHGQEFADALMSPLQDGHPIVSELKEQYLGR